ncbi:MAG: APC family permease [Thermodesulfobacteriota bacterium]
MEISRLKREVGPKGATIIGLGSMLGTGVYIAIGLAAGISGFYIFLSIVLSCFLAICNGFSSAQLAANHPTSGGTYEFGRIHLSKEVGFIAGWVFIVAKGASCATAALAIAGYIKSYFEIDIEHFVKIFPIIIIIILGTIIQFGLRFTIIVNTIIVSITIISLIILIVAGFYLLNKGGGHSLIFELPKDFSYNSFFTSFLYSTSLVFVAFTGYSRIATMAEDMKSPGETIRKAIFFSIMIVTILYLGVGFIGLSVIGADSFSQEAINNGAPLIRIAKTLDSQIMLIIISVGAVTAMLGVMLNLILGVSRVLLQMGRNHDMPGFFAVIKNSNPIFATLFACIIVAILVTVGDIKSNWALSAFKVLVYYSITNLAALKLLPSQRFYPRWVSYAGLSGCVLLVIFFEHKTLIQGAALILAGILWFYLFLLINRVRFNG